MSQSEYRVIQISQIIYMTTASNDSNTVTIIQSILKPLGFCYKRGHHYFFPPSLSTYFWCFTDVLRGHVL